MTVYSYLEKHKRQFDNLHPHPPTQQNLSSQKSIEKNT